MTFVGAALHALDGTAASMTITIPAATQGGDLMVAFVSYSQNVTVGGPTGWARLGGTLLGGLGNGGIDIWTKTAAGTPGTTSTEAGTTETFTYSGGFVNDSGVTMEVWRGGVVDTYGFANGGSASSVALPALSAATASDVLIGYWTSGTSSANGFTATPPANMTSRASSQTGPMVVADRTLTASGTIPTETGSTGTSGIACAAVLLKAANTAPTCANSAPADQLPAATPPPLAFSVTDPDSGQTDTLTVQVSTDSTFATGVTTLTTTAATPTAGAVMSVQPPANLAPGRNYYRGHVTDGVGGDSGWTAARSFYLDPVC